MNYRGHHLDPIKFWENYVQFPTHSDFDSEFSALVVCPNPTHDTNKRHFQINLRQPTVHCFAACGISGSYEHAIAIIEGIYDKYPDDERGRKRARHKASKIILRNGVSGKPERLRITLDKGSPKRSKLEQVNPGDQISLDDFSYLPATALQYLQKRQISSEAVGAFEIGWDAEEGRLVLPVRDLQNRLRFLIKRAVKEKDQPKYLYTEDAAKKLILYGAGQTSLRMIQSEGIVLVEGSIDCIRLHQHGIRNAVATLGTGISTQQAEIVHRLRPKRVILMFDKDLAGVHGIEIAEKRLKKIPLYVCRYPKGKSDPAEMTREEAYRAIGRAIPLRQFNRMLHRPERRITSGTIA